MTRINPHIAFPNHGPIVKPKVAESQANSRDVPRLANVSRLEDEIARLKSDPLQSNPHDKAVAAHQAKIVEMKQDPVFGKPLQLAELAREDA